MIEFETNLKGLNMIKVRSRSSKLKMSIYISDEEVADLFCQLKAKFIGTAKTNYLER